MHPRAGDGDAGEERRLAVASDGVDAEAEPAEAQREPDQHDRADVHSTDGQKLSRLPATRRWKSIDGAAARPADEEQGEARER